MARRFDESRWPTKTLEERLKRLEEMALDNVRQKTFKDQTIIFHNRADLNNQINEIVAELNRREGKTGQIKQIRITTRNKGFRPSAKTDSLI